MPLLTGTCQTSTPVPVDRSIVYNRSLRYNRSPTRAEEKFNAMFESLNVEVEQSAERAMSFSRTLLPQPCSEKSRVSVTNLSASNTHTDTRTHPRRHTHTQTATHTHTHTDIDRTSTVVRKPAEGRFRQRNLNIDEWN